jgi:coproporphyrinogen III oxidase-like Fe-S oxidoreductase
MKRNEITVEALKANGYKDYEFTEFDMKKAVECIKNGAECKLVPSFTGHMVAIIRYRIGVNVYEKEAFFRDMTDEEKIQYADEMNKQRKHDEEVSAKIHARNRAKMKMR